jgi:PEGA domain
LKANLIPDAFVAIKTTIDGLEPSAEAPKVPAVVVTAAQPDPESDAPKKEATVFIASVPPAASIFMDGRLIGKTNVGYVKVTSGKRIMQFLKGDMNCTIQMSFIEGINPAQVVRLPCLAPQ